jgi:protein-S-isoprenylcysteine O-methyltransferase Ste14
MPFDTYLTIAGIVSALLLIVGLLAGILVRQDSSTWRIWPAPPVGSLKSFAFWTLFRTLNVVVLVLAIERFFFGPSTTGTLALVQNALAVISVASFGAYLYTLWSLGRKATYCQASGLATGGVYHWTRNPQYTTAIVAFSALGLAADAWDATPLAAALVVVYALMAIAEEPWLEARYGRDYVDYRADVPRFFNLRHALMEFSALAERKSPSLVNGSRDGRQPGKRRLYN